MGSVLEGQLPTSAKNEVIFYMEKPFASLPTYPLSFPPTILPTYLPRYPPTYLPTYLPTNLPIH